MTRAAIIASLLLSGCAFGVADRPRPDGARLGVHRITCPSPPRSAATGATSVSVVPFPGDLVSVGERGHYNFDPGLDERVVIDGPDFARTIAADVAGVLGGAPSSSGRVPPALELVVTRLEATLDRGGFFSLRGTIRGGVQVRGRIAGADPAAPWPWTFEASAEKRVVYIRVGDYIETLGNAYCRVLEEISKRSADLGAATRALPAG
jgi:hypothetical protein